MSQAAPGYVLWCQTPPTRSPRSKTATFSYPARRSITAAPTPPKPPPTTAIERARPPRPLRPLVAPSQLIYRSAGRRYAEAVLAGAHGRPGGRSMARRGLRTDVRARQAGHVSGLLREAALEQEAHDDHPHG